MKIYQVEELVGITKKNIRFYEEEGLLNPERNPENGYREYTMKDVRRLERIKLLRKLSVPIEDIRLLQQGTLSFEESMKRQIERFEKEQKNAELMKDFCIRLKEENQLIHQTNQNNQSELQNKENQRKAVSDFNSLDAEKYLSEITKLEIGGTKFMNIEKEDINKKKKRGAVIAASIFCLLMLLLLIFFVYAIYKDKDAVLPLGVFAIIIISCIIGTIIALVQRFKEINKGEEYEAQKY